jgi:thiol-disulfide isomerase/thioredoxin
MKWSAIALAVLASTTVGADTTPVPKASAVLSWKNRETLVGELLEASATDMTWKATAFQDPLVLRWPALHRIDRTLAPIPVAEPFSFILRDGSHLLGDLVSVSDTSVSIRSARHGDAVFKRAEVLSARRIRGGDLAMAGPTGDVGWEIRGTKSETINQTQSPKPAVPIQPLKGGAGGALVLPYWNRTAFFRLNIPERVDIEFRVRSSARPDFRLSLENATDLQARIETWDDELVLAASGQFMFLRKIADDEREVALRVCWDRKTRTCSVFTPAGVMLAEWKAPEEVGRDNAGLLLQNKGRDLSLEFLRVRTWDGKAPSKVDVTQPRVELADGRVIEGRVVKCSAGSIKLAARGSGSETSLSLSKVDALIFSTEPFLAADSPLTLSYADGTFLRGRIEAVKEGMAAISMAAAEKPVESRMDGLRQLLINLPAPEGVIAEPPLKELDKLVTSQVTLHGKLTGAGDDNPRWLPVGGVRPTILSKSFSGEVIRALPPTAEVETTQSLFYTAIGDVIPGDLRALGRSGVQFDSGVVAIKELPAAKLDAIVFGVARQANTQGFTDARWRIIKGDEKTVVREKDALTMEVDTAIGHPTAMLSDEFQFSMAPTNGFSAVRLRLFCQGTDPAKSANLLLFHVSNRIQAGMETSEGQWDSQTSTVVPTGQPAPVRLIIDQKHVNLHINGVLTRRFPIGSSKRAGVGLIIEPASAFGNPSNPVQLSGFTTTSAHGATWIPDVAIETKTQALTVPRFRKDDPPRHALIAQNGDVLRGEIEAVTATHFGFRSGLETLRVPRERVKAAIWLKKPTGESRPAERVNPAIKLLEKQIETNSSYSGAGLSTFISVLTRDAPGLKIKSPDRQDSRRVAMRFGGQTVGEALEQLCSLFGLRYRLVEDGTVVLEAQSETKDGFVAKTYWLNSDTLSTASSAQAVLTEKGIPFPSGANVTWQPDSMRLSMVNTEANHEKLMGLLKAEFGGIAGSPTHWLSLKSGARIGFAVEKFEQETISGQHPVYGFCEVPMSQIQVIRSTMPDPTSTMKSLADWHLTYAPEPVLPESGGESSPLIGKEAKTFKLPLLGGGEFDLSAEKGKVIVLDFWATWCGPCVKSLPGLIEVMSAFPADRVKLIGVNQSEPADLVKRFLETRDWKLVVAMDTRQSVARDYGVDSIPHTVIVGPDGNVAWVKTGASAEGESEAAAAVKKLLESSASPRSPALP